MGGAKRYPSLCRSRLVVVGAIDQVVVEGDAMGFARAQPILDALYGEGSPEVFSTVSSAASLYTELIVK
jgi:hypothetical protein